MITTGHRLDHKLHLKTEMNVKLSQYESPCRKSEPTTSTQDQSSTQRPSQQITDHGIKLMMADICSK